MTDCLSDCSKRVTRSEPEFCGDHAISTNINTKHWYKELKTKQAASLVDTPVDASKDHLKFIEAFAPSLGLVPSRWQRFRKNLGQWPNGRLHRCIHAAFEINALKIKHVKADRPHLGKGLGGLLILAAEKRTHKGEVERPGQQ